MRRDRTDSCRRTRWLPLCPPFLIYYDSRKQQTTCQDNLYYQSSHHSILFPLAPSSLCYIKLLTLLLNCICMNPDSLYEAADLHSIIKSKQSPRASQENVRSEESRQQAASEQDYQSLKSQYTTNYISTQQAKQPRAYRQEVNILRNQQYPGEFIAYCVAVKESNLGIYSNERLIALDSHSKALSYYSQVPTLPLTDVSVLPAPKETISLANAKKFSYAPAKNGIGEVVVSWMQQDSLKEWRMTMCSRRVAKEFGIIIQQVKNNEHLIKKTAESVRKIEPPQPENRVNKKETTFIAQVKKLEEEQAKKTQSKLSLSSNVIAPQIVNDGSEVRFTNVPLVAATKQVKNKEETQTVQSPFPQIPKVQLLKSEQKPISIKPQVEGINSQINTAKPNDSKTPKNKSDISAQINNASIKSNEPPPPSKIEDKKQKVSNDTDKTEIKMDDIIKQAQKQRTYQVALRSPNSESKRFAELQGIINNRKSKEKYYRSSLNSHEGNRLSEKKALLKKIEVVTADSLLNHSQKIDTPKKSQAAAPNKRQSRYEDNYNSFRMSLLQQRRQNNLQSGVTRGQPKRQVLRSNSSAEEGKGKCQDWLWRWLHAINQDERANLYMSFVDQCERRVKKIACNLDNWHLLHKSGYQFHLEEEGIQMHYIIYRDGENSQSLFKKEQSFILKLKNWSYLLNFIQQSSKIQFRVPLACMVTFKGLKMFCKATFNKIPYKIVEDITTHINSLRQLEQSCKISLHRCQLYEIGGSEGKFLYFNQLDALPRLKSGEVVGSNYIRVFIKEGVIRNQLDIEEITRHIQDKLINKFIDKINIVHLLSTVEFNEVLNNYGLNSSFMVELYARACFSKLDQAKTYIASEIIASGLANCVRLGIHDFMLKERKEGVVPTVYKLFQLFLQGNLLLLQEIKGKLGAKNKQIDDLKYTDVISQYTIGSTLIKLGIRCDFRNKLSFQQLEDLGFHIWTKSLFSPQNVNLYIISNIEKYSYQNFISNSLLEETIFKKGTQLPSQLTKQQIISQLLLNPNQPYTSSARFRALPQFLKSRVHFYLAHFTPPNNRNLGLAFEFEYSELYFNLYQHSSAYLQTYEGYVEDLIGIKWLIKRGRYEQADSKLSEQRQRVWLWGRHHPQVLMEIYDLESLYALKRGRLQIAAERSLTALQLAIHYYGDKVDRSWQLLWEKAYFAATINYQSNRFDQAATLFETCISLSQRIKGEELLPENINQQFLETYNKLAVIQLTEGRIDQCILKLKDNLEKLKEWKIFFAQKAKASSILVRADGQMFDTYMLLLRCHQIKQNYLEYGQVLSQSFSNYFQKDWNSLYLNNPKLKLSDSAKLRLSQFIKHIWQFIVKSNQSINSQLLKAEKAPIKLQLIYQYLETIRFQNKGFYRYTSQELFKFMIQIVIRRSERNEPGLQICLTSRLINILIQSLSDLCSNSKTHKRCRLYDEESKENQLLLLESLTHLAGYEYCMGALQECFHNYSFMF